MKISIKNLIISALGGILLSGLLTALTASAQTTNCCQYRYIGSEPGFEDICFPGPATPPCSNQGANYTSAFVQNSTCQSNGYCTEINSTPTNGCCQVTCSPGAPCSGGCFELPCPYSSGNGLTVSAIENGTCQAGICTSVDYSTKEDVSKPINFTPQVTIPGSITIGGKEIKFRQGEGIDITGSTAAQYFAVFYRFFAAALVVIAVVMVMWGGFKRLMAAGSPEKIKSANDTIIGAITGIVLALVSYSLLALINPALVSFEPLKIDQIKRIDIDFGGDLPGAVVLNVDLCSNPQTLRGAEAAAEIVNYGSSFLNKVTYHLGAKDGESCSNDFPIAGAVCPREKKITGHPAGQSCFDCSGFVSYVYKCITGFDVPSYSTALTTWGGNSDIVRVKNMADLMTGDIYGWGQKTTGGNSGHVLLVRSRSNNKPSSNLQVYGTCTENNSCVSSSVDYSSLANKCLEDTGNSNRCFYFHLKRADDFTVACESGGSNVPCGLRSPAGRCEYREYDEYSVEGLSGTYKTGRLSSGCIEK